MFVFVLLFISLGFLPACTHMPVNPLLTEAPSPCTNIDWYEIGRLDGLSGSPLEKMDEQAKRCPDKTHTLDAEMYTNGRDAGLIVFCSAAGGLEAGKAGAEYENVCPEHLEESFLTNYKLGLQIRKLEDENSDLQERINNLSRLISPRSPSPSVRSQIEQLKNRRSQNSLQIIDLEVRAENAQL